MTVFGLLEIRFSADDQRLRGDPVVAAGRPFQFVTAGGLLAVMWRRRTAPAALLSNRQSVAMAVSALRGRRLVEDHVLALDNAR